MNNATLAILLASLVGSVHCAAMCGGFACFYTSGTVGRDVRRQSLTSTLPSHAMYNVGRLVAYSMLGAAAGSLGAHVTSAAAWIGIARGATIVAGLLMIGWSISHIASYHGAHIGALRAPLAWQRGVGSILNAIRNQRPATRAAATGLLTGLIPCGWLYVFVTTAGAAGSPLAGVRVMAIFWLGTLPALVAVGVGAQRLLAPLRARLPQMSAVVVLIMGLMAVSGRLVLTHVH